MTVNAPKKPLRLIPALPQRAPQANIPQTLPEREYVRSLVLRYVEDRRDTLVPPLVLASPHHADAWRPGRNRPGLSRFAGILVNNEVDRAPRTCPRSPVRC